MRVTESERLRTLMSEVDLEHHAGCCRRASNRACSLTLSRRERRELRSAFRRQQYLLYPSLPDSVDSSAILRGAAAASGALADSRESCH